MDIKPKIYFKNIDALRFWAFALVFISHSFFSNNPTTIFQLSWLHKQLGPYTFVGISFFFTLSAFLITWVILSEYQNNNSFNLKHFFVRRILRIWPLYLLIIFMAYSIIPFINDSLKTSITQLPNIWWFLTFTSNFYIDFIDRDFVFFLMFLWTIAVEEQFYLLWGLLMKFFHKNIPIITVVMVVVYVVFKLLRANDIVHSAYFNTVNYFINFALGAFLAYAGFNKNTIFVFIKKLPKTFWILFYITVFLSLLFFQQPQVTVFMHSMRHIVFTLFFCFILFDQCFNEFPLFNIGSNKWINYLGKISFGLYCWHGVVITMIIKVSQWVNYTESNYDVFIIYPLLALFLTILVSMISYEFFERKFLKLKEYFSAQIIEIKH